MKGEKIVVLICDNDEISMGINQKCVEIYSKRLNVKVELHCFLEDNDKMIQLVESGKVDIAILDVKLKNGCGIDVAKSLQLRKPKMPIIFTFN